MGKVPKTLHFKKAVLQQVEGDLQTALEKVLTEQPEALKRAESTSATVNRFRVIGQHYPWQGALAGILVAYEPGSKAASLINDPAAEQLKLDHFAAPPEETGKAREWVEGLLYFLIRENYVVLVQSSIVRHEQFEHHLQWLLTVDNDKPALVTLIDQAHKDVAKLIKDNHVKSVVIDGSLLSTVETAPVVAGEHVDTKNVKVTGPLLSAVKAALVADGHGFNWHDGLEGNLEAKLELTYRRKTTEQAQGLLDKLATAFRSAEGVDAEVVLNNGDRITHDKLRLLAKRNIQTSDGVLMAGDVFAAMHSWLQSLVAQDQI